MKEEEKIQIEINFNLLILIFQKPNRDVDVYEEVLKWQREIQERSVEETQNILNINLEQILKVR